MHRVRPQGSLLALLGACALACGPGEAPPSAEDPAAAAQPVAVRSAPAAASTDDVLRNRALYLELLKLSLLDLIYEKGELRRALRLEGRDFPGRAMTMIGRKRLDNLQQLTEDVLTRGVPGDLIEAGAWRGGATIFMRGILASYGITDRVVWVADSFEGLPAPDVEKFPADKDSKFHENEILAVSLPVVKRNFERYGLLDDQVRFLEGWFKDTLPDAPIERLAILRLDADMYQSTTEGLEYLYPKLSPGGYVILDDYACIEQCAKAASDYRAKNAIDSEIHVIDTCGVYWQKPPE
jgi:hypothetical protein